MSWKKKILLGVIILSILSLFVDLEPKDTHISIEHPSEVETIEKKPAQTENPDESITTEKPVTDEESQTNDEYYLLTVDGGDILADALCKQGLLWKKTIGNSACTYYQITDEDKWFDFREDLSVLGEAVDYEIHVG